MTKEKVETLPAVQNENLPATIGGVFQNLQRFKEAQEIALVLSSSDMIPMHFQKKPANVIIALNLADRLRIDPFMLMQNIYIVHGKPGIEGKLAIALINGGGRFSPLKFEFTESGQKTNKGVKRPDSCRAYATELKSGEVVYGPTVTWEMAVAEGWTTKDGSKWQTMPEMMFTYRAAMFFGRTNDPGSLLGLRSTDEWEDVINLEEVAPGQYAAPKTEPEPMTEQEISDTWNASIPEGTDTGLLIEFLEMVAAKNKKTVAEIKAASASNPKELNSFWRIFVGWVAKKSTKEKDPIIDAKTSDPVSTPTTPAPEPQPEEKIIPPAGDGNDEPKRGRIKDEVQKMCLEMVKGDLAEASKKFTEITGHKLFRDVPDAELNPVKIKVKTKYDLFKSEKK